MGWATTPMVILSAVDGDLDLTGWPALARQASGNHGVLTVEQAAIAGISRRQVSAWVDGGRLVRIGHGAYLVGGSPLTFEARVLGTVLVHGTETWASHRTAAALWGVPGFPADHRIDILRPADGSNARKGAVVHRSTLIPEEHVTVHRGIPVTTPARTLMDLSAGIGARRLQTAVAETIRRGLCTDTGLRVVLARLGGRGRPGTRRLRSVLDARDPALPTLSELEALARAVLVGAGVPEPTWQADISDEQGWIGRVDGLYAAARIVIELDSHEWHSQQTDVLEDARRDQRLIGAGFVVLRVRWSDLIHRPEAVIAHLQILLDARSTAA